MSGHNDVYFDLVINDAYIPEFLEEHDGMHDARADSGDFGGMIFMSNSQTKKECFCRKLFGLPGSYASIVKHIKPGMKLFLFEYEKREMHGVFEATTSGDMYIEPKAFKGSGKQFPAQVRFRRVLDCYPLSENDFKNAICENYRTRKEFDFVLSGDQVAKLIDLFGQQKIEFQVSVDTHYDEDSHDLSRTGIRHEPAGFRREIGINMRKRDYQTGDTMYGRSDGEQELACTRESYSKDLLCAGNVYAGLTVHDIPNAGQTLPSTGGRIFEDLCNQNFCAGQTLSDISDADQRLGSQSVQLMNYGNFDRLNSEHQPYYARHPKFVENISNAFAPIDNATNVDAEIHDNSYREHFFPSNFQHDGNLYYNGRLMSQGSLSLDSLPVISTKPVIEMSNSEGCHELRQFARNNLPVNNVSNSSRLYADDFQDGYCFPKQSVFSRLKRVPDIDDLREKEHALFRQTYHTNFPQQKGKRKVLSFALDEIESSGKQDESMSDAESTDLPTVSNEIVINFKRRSQVSKYGKEATLQFEGATTPSDGEQNSNKQKRRKLIRPQFDTVKVYENTMDVIQSFSKECPSQLVLPMTTILDDKEGGCDSRQESGEVLTNVMDHSDCCNVQPAEVKNKGLANLDGTVCYKKECPCQLVCMSSEILATRNAECDCGQQSGEVLLNVTEHSDCCNVQPLEVNDKGLAKLDGTESYKKECPCQLVCISSEILATKNAEYDCGQENREVLENVTEQSDYCNVQPVEVNNKGLAKLDDSESYKKECPHQLLCLGSEFLASKNAEFDCGQENREVLENVTEHSDCRNIQPVEVNNKGLAKLDDSESYEKECPHQLVCLGSEILASENAEYECGQENREVLENVTEHSDRCNVQPVEGKNKGFAKLDGSESYEKECPQKLVCLSSEILATKNVECDSGQENGKASSDSCNVQVVGEVESQDMTMVDLNKPYATK